MTSKDQSTTAVLAEDAVRERVDRVVRDVDRYWREIGMPRRAREVRRPQLAQSVMEDLCTRDVLPEIDHRALAGRWAGHDPRDRLRWA